MKKGTLIVLTGIDGSGKTTQAGLLVDSLRNKGVDASYIWCRWEPRLLKPIIEIWKRKREQDSQAIKDSSYRNMQKEKKEMLRKPILRYLWLFLFTIDYGLQVFYRIRLRLFKDGVIISDRIFYDSFIDQATNLGDSGDKLIGRLDSFYMKLFFPLPDMVIYIDCPEDVAYKRKNDAPDIEYLRERRMLYKELANRYGWVVVDGTLPVDIISGEIKRLVYNRCQELLS
jgi:dTMP kinase